MIEFLIVSKPTGARTMHALTIAKLLAACPWYSEMQRWLEPYGSQRQSFGVDEFGCPVSPIQLPAGFFV
jgi:hypothetical protein